MINVHAVSLNVFAQGPIAPQHPLLQLDNVVVAPNGAGPTYDT
jgi:phosphoglycerate dehydrogenase-like enzyme